MSTRDEIAKVIESMKDMESKPDYTLSYQVADQIITTLRANGWHYRDDIVEGAEYTCDHTTDCPNIKGPCRNCKHYRPATVGDLLKDTK